LDGLPGRPERAQHDTRHTGPQGRPVGDARYRIDETIKAEAAAVLEAMGLTVSDAFRMMMVRIAREKARPFELLVPNPETVATMREARGGKLPSFKDVDALMKDLDAGD
jgi:DNA-damage-inducible protein J